MKHLRAVKSFSRFRQRTPLIDGNRKSFVFEVCVDCELGSKRKTQKSLTVYKRKISKVRYFL